MPVAEITRAETRERGKLLQVHGYTVSLDLTKGDKIFGSESVISFDCSQPGASTYLDLIAEVVHEIVLNGEQVDPEVAWANGRIALAGLAASNELRVTADCAYTHDGSGLHRSVDSADGRVYTYTNLEPAEARKVYANFEQPDLKAEFTFHVTAPADWVVLSNQPGPEPEPIAGTHAATWHFPATPQISTYLTAVVAGEYHLETSSHTTRGGQVIPLGLACRQSLAEHLEAADMFTVTGQGLDFYTSLFEMPYPFTKYDQVFVPEFSAGAMENVGCVTWAEQMLFRSKVTDVMYEIRAMVLLHEMAHQWFGDLVTMQWWDDLWLNESFAEFSAAMAAAEATRFTQAWTTMAASRKTWGYWQDQLPSTHPIAGDVPTLSQAMANFDGISYAKGAAVLKQLVAYVGREQFFTGIKAYFAEHAWGNATLTDLLAALSAASGKDLADWSKAWLETAGPNTLRAEFDVDDQGRFSSFAVLQEAPPEHPTLRPHRIAVGLYDKQAEAGPLTRSHQVDVEVTGAKTFVPALVGMAQPDLILLNDDDLGYALIRFDERSLRTLTTSIGDFTDGLARTVSWSAVIDMVSQAELSYPAFVTILAAGMGQEPSVSVLQILHSLAARLMVRMADPADVPAAKDKLATVAMRELRNAEPGGDHQLAWAQLLGWTAVSSEQLDLVAGLYDGSTEIPGLTVDTELRWAFLLRLVATGRAGDAEIDAEAARDATDAGKRHALACRAAVPDAEHKEAAWRLLAESGELGTEGVLEVGPAFGMPEHAHLLAGYAPRFFNTLPAMWEDHGEQFRLTLGDSVFPYYAASTELLEMADNFLAADDLEPSLRRLILERRDMVAKALKARTLPV
jgi:aminopeptidase N